MTSSSNLTKNRKCIVPVINKQAIRNSQAIIGIILFRVNLSVRPMISLPEAYPPKVLLDRPVLSRGRAIGIFMLVFSRDWAWLMDLELLVSK